MEKFTPQPKLFFFQFNEYLKSISDNPISEGRLVKFIEENKKEFTRIVAIITNDRISRQLKEFIINGLAEELTSNVEQKIDPYDDDFYTSNIEKGYRVQPMPIYDDTMQITNHRYLRTILNPTPELKEQADAINIRYEKEDNNKFYYEQKAKTDYFMEKVSRNEMTFIGEMLFDEYINLVKKKTCECFFR